MIVDQFGSVISLDINDGDFSEIRKQYQPAGSYDEWGGINTIVHPSSLGRISYRLLRELYADSSAIRPAVDSITREISSKPWSLVHRDHRYHPYSEAKPIYDFLRHPNLDKELFPILISKYIHDCLVVGKGVIEKVRNVQGELRELVARDACLFCPRINAYGFTIDYTEYTRDTTTPARYHNLNDLIFQFYTPTSYTLGAIPIIETIVNEVALLMLCTKSIGWSFTRDEIPPGILHLGQIGEAALARAKASFEAAKGIIAGHKLRVVDNVDNVQWVQFTRTNRDQQVAELIPMIERVVFRNFGLSAVDSSHVDITRNVAETSKQSSQSNLTAPLMTSISEMLNIHVIEEFNPDYRFMYDGQLGQNSKDTAAEVTTLNAGGIITDNEARLRLGYAPIEGGDTRSVKLGNERVPLDSKTGEPKYRIPPAKQPSPIPPK